MWNIPWHGLSDHDKILRSSATDCSVFKEERCCRRLRPELAPAYAAMLQRSRVAHVFFSGTFFSPWSRFIPSDPEPVALAAPNVRCERRR
jgi:hypothetical protein